MPTSADGYAVDTSVAVAAIDQGHGAHDQCRSIVQSLRPALAGHAAFETFSVLTRMPGTLAVDAPTAAEIIDRVFPQVAWLDSAATAELWGRLAPIGIVGGAVYDALVGEAARSHGLTLLTRDRRALPTYSLLGVPFELVGP